MNVAIRHYPVLVLRTLQRLVKLVELSIRLLGHSCDTVITHQVSG